MACMALPALLSERRSAILEIANRRGAHNVRVFGSFARGTADDASDLDLLVDMDPDRSIFDVGALVADLETLLGRDVDVVTERGLKERIRARVLKDAVPL